MSRVKSIAALLVLAAGLLRADSPMDRDDMAGLAVYKATRAVSSFNVPGLLFHWKMNDSTANTTVIESVSNITCTAAQNTSVISVPGVINNALSFNGAGDKISLPNDFLNVVGTNPMSICFWIKVTGNTSANGNDKGFIIGGYTPFLLRVLTGNSFALGKPSGTDCFFTSAAFNTNVWNHFAFIGTLTGYQAYSNGVLVQTVSSSAGTNKLNTSGQVFRIGTDNAVVGWWFNGYLDDFRIYGRTLASNEVFSIYNNGSGTEAE